MADRLRLDDRDSSILYSSSSDSLQWQAKDDLTVTSEVGATVSVEFEGTCVYIYGQAMRTGTGSTRILSYTIDNVLEAELTGEQSQANQARQIYVESATLMPGRHTLLITNDLQDGWLGIDYLLVEQGQSQPSRPKLSGIAIAGIVTGSLVLLLLSTLVILRLYWIPRRLRFAVTRARPESPSSDTSHEAIVSKDSASVSWPIVTPFNLTITAGSQSDRIQNELHSLLHANSSARTLTSTSAASSSSIPSRSPSPMIRPLPTVPPPPTRPLPPVPAPNLSSPEIEASSEHLILSGEICQGAAAGEDDEDHPDRQKPPPYYRGTSAYEPVHKNRVGYDGYAP
ncbi:hypothetical protein DFP72DRAFT_1179124 [Ephemerocybe angulata]|uniref:Uncharacterized protein n=1 Tax=Ephemerocybe angulata TaxID=980116 RepID=A0A8H6HAP5_9AGAR|nr:hypothetical protein DFP72DRAFT_1179124 [Tulosesus angulatus]